MKINHRITKLIWALAIIIIASPATAKNHNKTKTILTRKNLNYSYAANTRKAYIKKTNAQYSYRDRIKENHSKVDSNYTKLKTSDAYNDIPIQHSYAPEKKPIFD